MRGLLKSDENLKASNGSIAKASNAADIFTFALQFRF
jgi:hypothetical protein